MGCDINFDNIDYLEVGTSRQRRAHFLLTKNQVLQKLKQYDPILVGTIPLNIDIENSDLDIICYFAEKQEFHKAISENFGQERNFSIREQTGLDRLAIVANFFLEDFEIEIFGQDIPTKRQFAYRHLVVEHRLLSKHGEKLRQQIVQLKRQGQKTEPAFASALGLTGNPYVELLKVDTVDNSVKWLASQ